MSLTLKTEFGYILLWWVKATANRERSLPSKAAINDQGNDVAPVLSHPLFKSGQWVRRYTQKTDINPQWMDWGTTWNDGWIDGRSPTEHGITLPAGNGWTALNAGARARFRFSKFSRAVVELRRRGSSDLWNIESYQLRCEGGKIGFKFVIPRGAPGPTEFHEIGGPVDTTLNEGQEFVLEAFVIGETLYGKLDGRLILIASTNGSLGEGGFEVGAGRCAVRDIEFINLDGLSKAEALKAAGLSEAVTSKHSRDGALLALSKGATVEIAQGAVRRLIKPQEPLPDSPFRLVGIRVPNYHSGLPIKPADVMTFLEASELESLDLHAVKNLLNDDVCQKIATLQRLREINLGYTNLSDAWMVHFAGLPALQAFHAPDTTISDRGLEHLASAASLTALNCTNTRVSAEGLSKLPSLPHLTRLSVGNGVGDITSIVKAAVTSARSATKLGIKGKLETAALDGIQELTKLGTVEFSQTDVTGELCKKLAEAPGLHTLSLMHCRASDSFWTELPRIKKLARLTLVATDHTPALEAALKQFTKPPELIVENTDGTDFGESSTVSPEQSPAPTSGSPVFQKNHFPSGQWVRFDPSVKAQPIIQVRTKEYASLNNGWLKPSPMNGDVATFAAMAPKGTNWGARATFRWSSIGQARVGMRSKATGEMTGSYVFQVEAGNSQVTWQKVARQGTKDQSPRSYLMPPVLIALQPEQEVCVEGFAIGGALFGRVNDKVFMVQSDKVYLEGAFEISSTKLPLKDIEFINLDGLSEAEALKAAGIDKP